MLLQFNIYLKKKQGSLARVTNIIEICVYKNAVYFVINTLSGHGTSK